MKTDYPKLIAERAAAARPSSNVSTFDPTTLALVASLVWELLRYCLAASIRRQWEQLNAHPHGFTERKLRGRLTRQFLDDHPNADTTEIDGYVADTLTAFRTATRAEIEQMIEAAHDRNETEPVNWEAARHCAELTEITE